MMETWKECKPLSEVEADRPQQETLYKTWNEMKSK